MNAPYAKFQRAARLWAVVAICSLVITPAARCYAQLYAGAGSTAKIDSPGLFKFVVGGQGVNSLSDSNSISFGAGAFGSVPFYAGGAFDYLATIGGGGTARYGAL